VIAVAAGLALVFAGWPTLVWAAARVRDGHRWAAHVCSVGGKSVVCKWRNGGTGASGIRGVWNGVGVEAGKIARLEWPLPAGKVRVRARLDLAPVGPAAGTVVLSAGDAEQGLSLEGLERESRAGRTVPVELQVNHRGGPLVLTLESRGQGPRIWLGDLRIEGP
jgi:hypothetical protein